MYLLTHTAYVIHSTIQQNTGRHVALIDLSHFLPPLPMPITLLRVDPVRKLGQVLTQRKSPPTYSSSLCTALLVRKADKAQNTGQTPLKISLQSFCFELLSGNHFAESIPIALSQPIPHQTGKKEEGPPQEVCSGFHHFELFSLHTYKCHKMLIKADLTST